MGSTEQQGIHSLTGDYLAAEAIAKRVAEKAGAYYVPVIPFGCSEYFRCFPGTISLRPSTVEAVITDVVESLTEHGITKSFSLTAMPEIHLLLKMWQENYAAKRELYVFR